MAQASTTNATMVSPRQRPLEAGANTPDGVQQVRILPPPPIMPRSVMKAQLPLEQFVEV